MKTYITCELDEDDKANAIVVPAETVYAHLLVLADTRPATVNPFGRLGASRAKATERFLAIFREIGVSELDFSDEKPKKPCRFEAVRRLFGRYAAGFARLWLWNVSYPVRMWFHLRFYRERTLPRGSRYVAALLREAFAVNGVTDLDLPYPVRSSPVDEKPAPDRF